MASATERAGAVRDTVLGWAESLSAHVLAAADAREVLQAAVAIKHAAATVEGMAAQAVAGSSMWRESGDRSAAHFLSRIAGTSVGDARDTLSTAERLDQLPATQEAALRGELSPRQSSLISGAAAADPTAEGALLSASKTASLGELTQECAKRRAAADPDPEATRARIHRGRYLRTHHDVEGAWHLHARATADTGARFMAALGPFTEERFHEARRAGMREPLEAYQLDALATMAEVASAGGDAGGDGPCRGSAPPGCPEVASAIGAADGGAVAGVMGDPPGTGAADGDDAAGVAGVMGDPPGTGVAGVAGVMGDPPGTGVAQPPLPLGAGPGPGGARAGPAPGRPSPAPTAGGDGRIGAVPGGPAPGRPSPEASAGRPRRRPPVKIIVRIDMDALLRGRVLGEETCEIAGVGPVPVSVVQEMLESDNPFLAAVVTKGKAVAGVVHLGRRPTAHQVTALEWRSPTCAVLGCSQSARLEIDHLEDWADTHVTRIEALEHKCAYHHWLKTTQGWALVEGTGKRPMVPPSDPRHPKYVARVGRAGPRARTERAERAPPGG